MSYRELLLGCGHRRARLIDPLPWYDRFKVEKPIPLASERWQDPLTVDNYAACKPDLLMDLRQLEWIAHSLERDTPEVRECLEPGPYPDSWRFRAHTFDEVHAYEVLEHLGQLGDEVAYFAHFQQIWRILKPGGFLCASVPSRFSQWLWGDPGHSRAILPASLVFLSQAHYAQHVGKGPSSDYRHIYSGDFHIVLSMDNEESHNFILQALK